MIDKLIKEEYLKASKVRSDLFLIPILNLTDMVDNYQLSLRKVRDYLYFNEIDYNTEGYNKEKISRTYESTTPPRPYNW